MELGTALTKTATKALLLGSGELGKEIAIALQRYGVEVIAVDRYANAPAQHVAHRSHVIDMTDSAAIKQLVEQERPHLIIPEIEAIATEALAEIERQGLSQVIPNARAVQLTMNREGIRGMAAEAVGLPTSKYAFAKTYQALKTAVDLTIGYPCFIKPTMSSSGKGQSKVMDETQLKQAWTYAKSAGRTDTGKVIVESAIDFDYEITLLTVRALNSQGHVETHYCAPIGHLQQNGDYRESWQPQPMSTIALQQARDIAGKVTENIGGLGLFGVELFVKGDRVWFSEVSPRPHDTGMVTLVTQRQTEFDLHVRAILGLPVSTHLDKTGASAVILADQAGQNIRYLGVEQALADSDVSVRLFAKPEAHPERRMGVVLASAETIERARDKAVSASKMIQLI